jgi:hypothetical protein
MFRRVGFHVLPFATPFSPSRSASGARLREPDPTAHRGQQAEHAVAETNLAGEHVPGGCVVAPHEEGRRQLQPLRDDLVRPVVAETDRDGEAGMHSAGSHLNVVGLGDARRGVVRELSDQCVGGGVVHPVLGRSACAFRARADFRSGAKMGA